MSESTAENPETSSIDDPQIVDTPEVPRDEPGKPQPENKQVETESDEEASDTEAASEESSEEESEEESDTEYETIDVVPDSEMYAISVDGKPRYYVRTPDEADLCMWHVARRLVHLSPDYKTRYVKVGKNELHIERQCNWYVMSYAETVHRLSYREIRGIRVQTVVKEKEE
jgi:hypothetical protein